VGLLSCSSQRSRCHKLRCTGAEGGTAALLLLVGWRHTCQAAILAVVKEEAHLGVGAHAGRGAGVQAQQPLQVVAGQQVGQPWPRAGGERRQPPARLRRRPQKFRAAMLRPDPTLAGTPGGMVSSSTSQLDQC
jgi:hypothetical protein